MLPLEVASELIERVANKNDVRIWSNVRITSLSSAQPGTLLKHHKLS